MGSGSEKKATAAIPELRFPEFEGEWIDKRLEEIAIFSKGKGISKADISENGQTECIRYGQLYTDYDEKIDRVISKTDVNPKSLVLSRANDVIIPASGESQIDIATASCVVRAGIALGGDLNIIRTNENGVFLSFYLNSQKKLAIARLAQGISVVHVYATQLKSLKLNLPTRPEQEKISTFLEAVDEKITQLTRKRNLLIDYKKGCMQKIFSQELRFKDYDGCDFPDWSQILLGELTELLKDGTHGTHPDDDMGKYFLLSAKNIQNGQVQFDHQDRRINENEFNSIYKNYKLQKNDLLLSVVGTIGRVAIFDGNPKIAFQRSVAFFRVPKHSTQFIFQYMQSEKFQKELIRRQVVSAQPGIYLGDLAKISICFPCPEEQEKIATFLSALDSKIDLLEHETEKTKTFKQGLLQKMFV